MKYLATYTELNNGGTWGQDAYEFDAYSEKEAKQIALERERYTRSVWQGGVMELLLDSLTDENGNEITIDYDKDKHLIRHINDIERGIYNDW